MSEPLRKRQKLQESGHQHRKTPPAGSSTLKTQGSLERWLKKNIETQNSSPQPRPPQGSESLCPSDGEQNPATSAPETGIEHTSSGSGPEELQGRRTSKITHFFTKAPGKAPCGRSVAAVTFGKVCHTEVAWLGVPLSDLQREPDCSAPLPALRATDRHTVLIRTDLLCPGEAPVPFPSPDKRRDCWDNTHVKMPCSDQNLFPVEQTTLQSRWDLIKKALNAPFRSSHDVKDAILKYNAGHAKQWSFTALHSYCKGLQESESAQMFGELLPAMAQLALRASSLLTQPLPLLTAQHHRSVTLSQEQVSCLLANAFFCTFPRRNSRRSEYSNYPDINFSRLFEGSSRAKQEKLKTLLCYFKRVTQRRPGGLVTYTRQCLQHLPVWSSSEKQFRRLHICCDGTIEEQGYGMLQVDFANRFVGGGVTGSGLVQEEIRFLINPELIAARLFTEALEDNECLIITGTEQFSRYSGYSDTYRWDGNHDDQTPRDEWLRSRTEIVAIDALHYRSFLQQFQPDCVTRELNKAYCGFTRPGARSENLSAVATGNWGCGVFGGDTRLKALLQMMAAAEADRDLMYFTFGDVDLQRDVHRIHTLITHTQATVGSVFSVLLEYYECVCKETQRGKPQETLYSFLLEHL